VRYQICEAELTQALGRGRGVNRTADTPLDIDLLVDACLPVTVDEVIHWAEPSAMVEMAVDGVVLSSPIDMTRLYPKVWANERAAYRTLETLNTLTKSFKNILPGTSGQSPCKIYYQGLCQGVRSVTYQPDGPKKKRRIAWFNPELAPDPRAWLEDRLGPLAQFEVEDQ
jgi:putative DNA primase/helicase